MRKLLRLRRDQEGLVALEFLIVVVTWLAALSFMADMCLMLGNGVLMQSAVNRAALQASAEGCLSPESQVNVENLLTLLGSNVHLNAVWVPSNGGPFDRNLALQYMNGGNPTSHNAACPLAPNASTSGDLVPQSGYIFIELDYDQHVFLPPTSYSVHVVKTALAVSSSLNLEQNG